MPRDGFEQIDPSTYVDWEKAACAQKTVEVRARLVPVGTVVNTVMKDGHLETSQTVQKPNSYLVINPDGEEYVIDGEKLKSRYEPGTLPKDLSAVSQNGIALRFVPENLSIEPLCTKAVNEAVAQRKEAEAQMRKENPVTYFLNKGADIIENNVGKIMDTVEEFMDTSSKFSSYRPIFNPIEFVEVKDDVEFEASWGETMYIKAGGVIVKENGEEGKFYGIQKDEFTNTYGLRSLPGVDKPSTMQQMMKDNYDRVSSVSPNCEESILDALNKYGSSSNTPKM